MKTLALALLLLALAGCVTPPAATSVDQASVHAGIVADVQTLMSGVACEAKGVGETTSTNLKMLSTLAYDESEHGEIDARGDWLLAARYSGGGFELSSIADPLHPVKVAVYQSQEHTAFDVKWMPDNESAIVGHGLTIDLVDVSDILRSNLSVDALEAANMTPRLVSVWTYPVPPTAIAGTNMHMLTTARIGGQDYVFVAPNDNTGVWILHLTGAGDARKLEVVTMVGAPLGGGPLGPHDMSLVMDDILHKPVLYVANGFEGWQAFDVSDPKAPSLLAEVPNLGPAQGYTHTVIGQKVGDRRLVAMIQEVGSNWLSIYDATDFRAPILLVQWQADHTNPTTPQHNIQLVNGTLYVAHYTHGVYAFDLHKIGNVPLVDSADFAPIAHYAPSHPTSGGALGFANVWDVLVHDGLLYVNDMKSGTDVVGFGCLHPGDAAAESQN